MSCSSMASTATPSTPGASIGRADRRESWLLAEEPRLNIYTVGYRVRSSNWFGGAMQLSERVINVFATLQTTLRADIPILFVCHSYGGLVAKEMLRVGLDIDRAYTDVVRRTAGLAFFGTPHAGSRIANYISAMETARPSRAVRELRANNARLFDLSHWFKNRFAELGVRIVILYETMDTYGVRVVDRDSSDPGINGITPIPFDSDHVDLPKPQDEGDRASRSSNASSGTSPGRGACPAEGAAPRRGCRSAHPASGAAGHPQQPDRALHRRDAGAVGGRFPRREGPRGAVAGQGHAARDQQPRQHLSTA